MVVTGFYLLTGVMILSPIYMLNKSTNHKKVRLSYLIAMAIWLGYITTISKLGILNNFELPPRMPMMIVIPIIIMILIITSRKFFKEIMNNIPIVFPIYIQSFRIVVELLIYGAYLNGIFPKAGTFEGMNYDILVGISALLIGLLVQKNMMGRRGILIWNTISLMVLGVTVYSFVSTYYFTDYAITSGNMELVTLPYILLPGILLPFAVFYHVVSIRQQLR